MTPTAHPRTATWTAAAAVAALVLGGCAETPQPDPEDHSPDTRIEALLRDSEEPVVPLASGDTVRLGEEVREFYRQRDHRAAWTSEDGLLPRGKALIAALHESGTDGLDLEGYHRESVHALLDRARADVEQDLPVGDLLGNLDMVLTEAFLRYSTDLRRGTIDPSSAGVEWRIDRGDATDAAWLEELVSSEDLESVIADLRPAIPLYDRLRKSLVRYREIADRGGWPTVSGGETLEVGSEGERVVAVRRRLTAEGDPGEAPLVSGAAEPAVYDSSLAAAVEHFQRRHGIVPDGKVGAGTLEQMNVPVQDRIATLKLNLDRVRWLPGDLGDHYVMVNVAGQEMAVVKDDEAVLSMNVVVGEVANQTPIFRDTMEYVVLNPYWNVPESIAENEIWPKVEADPGYLARNNYEVVGDNGTKRIRQKPGPTNALGHVKFLFPNDLNIYLHDTPADHLFGRTARAFSHGCIRLERPMDLARYVLENTTDRDPEEALRTIGGKEEWIQMREKLPVYILYFTAWAQEDGSTRFYPDVYSRDAAVEKVARATLEDRAPSSVPAPGPRVAVAGASR